MKVIGSDNPVVPPSNNQQNFQNSLAKAAKKLFKHLGECHIYPIVLGDSFPRVSMKSS